jgi:hypothetical protein
MAAAAQARRHQTGRVVIAYLERARELDLDIACRSQHYWVPALVGRQVLQSFWIAKVGQPLQFL